MDIKNTNHSFLKMKTIFIGFHNNPFPPNGVICGLKHFKRNQLFRQAINLISIRLKRNGSLHKCFILEIWTNSAGDTYKRTINALCQIDGKFGFHPVLSPGKIFHFPEKLATHRSANMNGDTEANKPIREKKKEIGQK